MAYYWAMDAFYAVADPTRRRIIETLARDEQAFGDIAGRFDMSRPAVSQHLKVLRDAGIVNVRRDGQRRIYALERGGLNDIDGWLARVRSFWSDRLDRLEAVLRESNVDRRKT